MKPDSEAESDKSCWSIPLSYTTQKDADFNNTMPKYWLNCKEKSTEIKTNAGENEWIILNVNAAGKEINSVLNVDSTNTSILSDLNGD